MIVDIVEKRDDSSFVRQCNNSSHPIRLAQFRNEGIDVGSISYSKMPRKTDGFGDEVVNDWSKS
jgi:hypothetical protein